MIKAAVLGATGYTGLELVRLLHAHPGAEAVYLGARRDAGKMMSEVHPQFKGCADQRLQDMQAEGLPPGIDIAFCALPHGHSAPVAASLLKKGLKVVDLSADFRLKKPALYRQWYAFEHPCPEYLEEAVYGLPELYEAEIAPARLVANPGCYPTAVLLGLAPLLRQKGGATRGIIVDAKSGVSGAGRAPKQPFHFPDCTENFKAYRVASHQHTAEMEQELSRLAGRELVITFTPHLVPMARGILSTMYIEFNMVGEGEELQGLYEDFYRLNPLVRVLGGDSLPETRYVRGSNFCDIALRVDGRTGRLIIISAIDNLVRGASGQALQNMNIMFGLPAETGLGQVPL